MRIAFDLDDTLIPSRPDLFAVEKPRGLLGRLFAQEHLRHGTADLRRCSKYPPAFGIDLLVDDSEGVWLEGQQFRFNVVHVLPSDVAWAEKVLAAVKGRPPLAGPRQDPPHRS